MVSGVILVMSFSLFDVLPGWVGTAAEFFLGEDRSLGGKGDENRGLLGSGADSFLRNIKTTEGTAASRSAAEQRRITMDVPNLTGTAPGGRARVQGVSQNRPFVGSSIPQVQSAISRAMGGKLAGGQYSNLWRTYAAPRNLAVGRNVARATVGSTAIKGVKPIAAASPVKRTDTKVV